MADRYIYISDTTDPYRNLAVEEWLTENVKEDSIVLFLWQNRDTVVIGKNQDAYSECDAEALDGDGILTARRLSGGGAVFHDTGNLNFSFCAGRSVYDVERQTGVILEAVKSFGIDAERTGRNDIEAMGSKFSGNAFFKKADGCCHHGTIMMRTDPEKMMRYLTPDKEKLAKRAVASVKARTVNLGDLNPDITPESMKEALIHAFRHEYKSGICIDDLKRIIDPEAECVHDDACGINAEEDMRNIRIMEERFSSREWIFGGKYEYNRRFKKRFSFGGVDVRMNVEDGIIKKARVFSDALDTGIAGELEKRLSGEVYDADCLEDMVRMYQEIRRS